jgi:pimeloyl-ACP methyl ester carboxylesterase
VIRSTWEAALAACRARYPLREMAIDGAIWSFLDTGAGDEALLLLPGAMGFADTSFHFVLAFAPQMRVISVGYPATVTDGDRLVDGLAALLTAQGVAAAHVVGGSYSGLVAQRLAERHPTQVCALILANTWAPDPARARWFRPAAWLVAHTPGGLLQRFMARYVDRFLHRRGRGHGLLARLLRRNPARVHARPGRQPAGCVCQPGLRG